MQTIDEQIAEIEKILQKTPHHKATNAFIGKMRAKISRLKDKEIESKSKHGGGKTGFHVKKQGDATVVLVGPPSCGKSTLINKLTNAESKVAPYAFTTVTVIPGMLKYKEAYIQILDIPGLIEGAKEGRGRGKEVLSVARAADLIVIMTDVERVSLLSKINDELEGAGIRLNKKRPDITIEKKVEGGLEIKSNIKQELDKDAIKEVAREYGINNGIISIKENVNYENLFDAFSRNRVYIPSICVVNKIDIDKNVNYKNVIKISAEKDINIQELINEIWNKLNFLTIYLSDPNYDNKIDALIMKNGNTIADVALKIGSDFIEKVKTVKIWGNGAKFSGQEVSINTPLQEGMKIKFY